MADCSGHMSVFLISPTYAKKQTDFAQTFCVCAYFRTHDCMWFRVLHCASVFDLDCFVNALLDTDDSEKIFNMFSGTLVYFPFSLDSGPGSRWRGIRRGTIGLYSKYNIAPWLPAHSLTQSPALFKSAGTIMETP